MPLNPSGQISLGGPVAGQSIALELGLSATATISLNDTNVRTLAGVASGVIVMPTDFYGKSSFTVTQKAIFGYGSIPGSFVSTSNLVSNTGVVASDTPGVGTARRARSAAGYGGDKAIFAFGAPRTGVTNLVSNTGVVASDTLGVPGVTTRGFAAGAGYGGDKAIFGYGLNEGPNTSTSLNVSNLVSNTGVLAINSPAVGTARSGLAAAGYSTS